MPYAINKGADQPENPCSLISAYLVRCKERIPPASIYIRIHGVQCRMISVDNFLDYYFCCVHDVETIFHLSYVLTVSGNLF